MCFYVCMCVYECVWYHLFVYVKSMCVLECTSVNLSAFKNEKISKHVQV